MKPRDPVVARDEIGQQQRVPAGAPHGGFDRLTQQLRGRARRHDHDSPASRYRIAGGRAIDEGAAETGQIPGTYEDDDVAWAEVPGY